MALDFLPFDTQPAQRDIEAIADEYLAEVTSPAHSMQTLVV